MWVPLISFVNCKNSRICQHILPCGLLFSASPFILDPHTLKNVRNAKSVAMASPGPSLCSWAGAVLGCPCQCLPWFLLLWKLDSLEQHLQAFAGWGKKENPQNALRHPFSAVLCYSVMDQRTLGSSSVWKRGLLTKQNLIFWAATPFRKWHVLPSVRSFLDLWGLFVPVDVTCDADGSERWQSWWCWFNQPRHRHYSPNTRFFCY